MVKVVAGNFEEGGGKSKASREESERAVYDCTCTVARMWECVWDREKETDGCEM